MRSCCVCVRVFQVKVTQATPVKHKSAEAPEMRNHESRISQQPAQSSVKHIEIQHEDANRCYTVPRTTKDKDTFDQSRGHRIPVLTSPTSPTSGGFLAPFVSASVAAEAEASASRVDCEQFVIVAIDFGTTFSGYAFSFTRDPEHNVHMMRKWEGGDPGVINQKTPTTLLLKPNGEFHSFGFAARDFFHDLDAKEAQRWMFFEKFKMLLHHDAVSDHSCSLRFTSGQNLVTIFRCRI